MSPGALTVLYIDDDRNDLALFGMAVDATDFDIWLYTVSSGAQAIEFLEECRLNLETVHALPDVLLLDLRMPAMTGLDLLRWKQTSPFKSIPVAVFSSALNPDEGQEALQLGADKCIEKPMEFKQTKALVAEIWRWGTEQKSRLLSH